MQNESAKPLVEKWLGFQDSDIKVLKCFGGSRRCRALCCHVGFTLVKPALTMGLEEAQADTHVQYSMWGHRKEASCCQELIRIFEFLLPTSAIRYY